MAQRFQGVRGLGLMDPVMRSNMLRMSRALKGITAANSRVQPNEEEVLRKPGVQQQRGYSSGGRAIPTSFGIDTDKPDTVFLLARGTGAFLYVATDTNKVYMWTGTAYKSATFA